MRDNPGFQLMPYEDYSLDLPFRPNSTLKEIDAPQTLSVDAPQQVVGEWSANFDLDSIDGSNGFRINGINGYDSSGFSVSSAGDINGDGFDDLIIGSPFADPDGKDLAGESYVVFGSGNGFAANIDLADLDGSNGFRLVGIDSGDISGRSVSAAGDVNGDGLDDIIIGAYGADRGGDGGVGESYVVFGSRDGFGASVDLGSLDGSNGFRLVGIHMGEASGYSVSSAGDVNGDGYGDVIIGALRAHPDGFPTIGGAYVVFGSGDGFAASFDLADLDGSNGFLIEGIDTADDAGHSVSSAGDVNGDGYDDVIIGATNADPGGTVPQGGESYVVFGSGDGITASINLADLDGSNGFRINGVNDWDYSGFAVSSAGDVNGDGYGDLIIGAPYADPGGDDRAGNSYVVFGSGNGFAASIDLADLDGSNGFRIGGIDPFDFSGLSVSSAGDVNGDGFDDLIVGAPYADPRNRGYSGESYVIFGKANGFAATFSPASLNGSNGFRIRGIDPSDHSGYAVSSAGDVNGDGFADLIVGAPQPAPYGLIRPGASFVIFGKMPEQGVVRNGTDSDNRILGGLGNDVIDGRGGDDMLISFGGDDILYGMGGEDFLDGQSGNDTFFGGSRADEIFGSSGDDQIFGEGGNDRTSGGSGNDMLDGGANNDLLIGGPGNDILKGGGGDDYVAGGSGIDTADYSGSAGAVVVDLVAGTATGEGNDTLTGIENVTGSAFDDLLYGDAGNNVLDGLGGEDFFHGRSGNDMLLGGSRADEMFGGSGNDVIEGQGGNDRANGGSGADRIDGGGGGDLLVGGPGNDVLIGGAGDDTMVGGSDDDRFVFAANSGADTINGFLAGAGSEDVLDFTALGIGFGDLAIAQQGADTLITTPGGDTVLLTGVLPGQLDQASDFLFGP